jgi:hypothetical protein
MQHVAEITPAGLLDADALADLAAPLQQLDPDAVFLSNVSSTA